MQAEGRVGLIVGEGLRKGCMDKTEKAELTWEKQKFSAGNQEKESKNQITLSLLHSFFIHLFFVLQQPAFSNVGLLLERDSGEPQKEKEHFFRS